MATTMIMREDNKPDYPIDGLTEVLEDILERMNPGAFSGVTFGINKEGKPALRYIVNLTDTEIIKLFDGEQGTPELKADVIEFMFGMLDSAANVL